MKTCSICQNGFSEWGNNAQPINDGRCCDKCNNTVVIPARIIRYARSTDKTFDKRLREAMKIVDSFPDAPIDAPLDDR